jgi:hypothetical protein
VVHLDYNKFGLKSIDVPKEIENIIVVKDTAAGMYAGITDTIMSDSELYHLPKNSNQWVKRIIPSHGCKDVIFLDDSGQNIEVICSEVKIRYRTANGGITWQ